MPGQIIHYVYCHACRCSVHDWAGYRWHLDQGHALSWQR